jgi:hypothetical protein
MKEDDNDLNDYPKQRSFTLYVMLFCGILVSLLGLYVLLTTTEKQSAIMYFDGESFVHGKKNGTIFILAGIGICIFPAYHFYKKNHKQKQK